MAGTITINHGFQVALTGGSASGTESVNLSITMAGENFIANVQTVGTSNEALVFGDVAAGGWVIVKNLDATNYVEVFLDSGNSQCVAKLLPGEDCRFKPNAAVYARANTGACMCFVLSTEL